MSNQIVFLSHSSKDKKALAAFKDALAEKTNGTIRFFLSSDGESIPFGTNWIATVESALKEAKLAFLFLTPNSVGSTWVAFEAGHMYSKGIRVVPLALPGTNLDQVQPPLSLLQGHNVHSAGGMNNVFKILNDVFRHKHALAFTEADFEKIFGAESLLGHGYFGKQTSIVENINFHIRTKPEPLPKLKSVLPDIDFIIEPRENGQHAAGTGILADSWGNSQTDWYLSITVHVDMCASLLPIITGALTNLAVGDYTGSIGFVYGVEQVGNGLSASVRARGTELKTLPQGRFQFRDMIIGRNGGLFDFESKRPIAGQDLQELVDLLFKSEILRFNPEKQKQRVSDLFPNFG